MWLVGLLSRHWLKQRLVILQYLFLDLYQEEQRKNLQNKKAITYGVTTVKLVSDDVFKINIIYFISCIESIYTGKLGDYNHKLKRVVVNENYV